MGFWSGFWNILTSPGNGPAYASTSDNNCRIQIRVPSEGFWRDYGSTTESTCSYDMQGVKRGYHEEVNVRTVDSHGRIIDFI